MTYVRPCPRCGSARPADEYVCQGRWKEEICGWSLYDVLPVPADAPPPGPKMLAMPPPEAVPPGGAGGAVCRQGHPLEPGEFMCMVCGEPAAQAHGQTPTDAGVEPAPRVVNGWILGTGLPVAAAAEADLCLTTREPGVDGTAGDDPGTAVFKHYRGGLEPSATLYPALRTLDPAHGLRLLDVGRWENRAFEVWEYLPLGSLADIGPEEKAALTFVRATVCEIGAALHGLGQVRIVHRDLKPANVLVRAHAPLDLVLAGFDAALPSEFDLQSAAARPASRYAAPETVAGACSGASDWWSLGVIVLEMLTRGRGFEGVDERAFLLHLITRGLRVPIDLPEEWRELLMGLLTRDPARRWGWTEVARWLEGERGIPHGYAMDDAEGTGTGRGLRLGNREWSTPESFALAAAESGYWDEARNLLLSGRLATWLQARGGARDPARAAHTRRLAADLALPEDARLAAALLALNDNLPLCLRGEIITPAWLLTYPDVALSWLDGPLPEVLRRLERGEWFVRLRERADRVRARVRETGLAWDHAQLSAALLATSRPMLEARWRERRRLFPEPEPRALAAAAERRIPTDEDLILLVSAPLDLFRPADDVLDEVEREARRASVGLEREAARPWLERSRREILDALDERLRGFVRCGRQTADEWADDFRQEHRLPLARTLTLLAIPMPEWREPPRQEYVRNVLEFCCRRLATGLQRGALVRMTIGKTTARLDLTELGGPARSPEALLAAVLARSEHPVTLDPAPLVADPRREQRLRRLNQTATAYRRDTGISALHLGFPFVTLRDARAGESTRPRIAPVLLWPVRLETLPGAGRVIRLAFEPGGGEARFNPALEGLLGDAAPAWRAALNDLRGREHLDLSAVLDGLIPLAPLADPAPADAAAPRLQPLPPATFAVASGQVRLHASAVLFLSDFSGQTIARDLEALAVQPVAGTALAVAIRADAAPAVTPTVALPAEADRYFTAASDPSQQAAVFRARQAPGLVVQGPPGTGKSQTIVNVVGDALGRGERVLIVCQKPAALEVVRKRLAAEGLTDRLFFLRDAVSDRAPLLRALRAQLDRPRRLANDDALLGQQRLGLARHVEALEGELDRAHAALREARPDGSGGLSYRALLEGLMEVERGPRPPLSLAALGPSLRPLDHSAAEQLTAALAPLASLWLEARYEDSPLHCLAHFRADEAAAADFQRVLAALREAESRRDELLRRHDRFFDLVAPEGLQRWLADHEAALRALPPVVAQSLARHADLFTPPSGGGPPLAEQIVPWLEHLEARLRVLDGWTLAPALYEKLAARAAEPLRTLAQDAGRLAVPRRSFFARLDPGRWLARRRVAQWLRGAGSDPDDVDPATLRDAAGLELELREERAALRQWRETLGDVSPVEAAAPLPAVRAAVRRLLERLQPVVGAARRVQACPVENVAEELRLGGDPSVCAAVLDACRASLALWSATRESEACLERAAGWFDPAWVAERQRAIAECTPGVDALDALEAALPTLSAFQTFRLRAKDLDPVALPLLARLREREDAWRRVPVAELAAEIARTLRREAFLAWKGAAEEACPALLMDRAEAEQKVRLLGEKDAALRTANRRLLAHCPAAARVADPDAWADVVMLTGPRARRLREVIERGDALGLFQLRPVWLANPEMVSRIFPLRAGLFDLVIFDEASQLPVEGALPALFRARRVVVSGDEKQMPPSRFFGAALESDEDEEADAEAEDETLGDEERERLAQATGRREVKDCPDLLALTQNLLPTATLEIHYRSKYRPLIEYSNAAFYGGRLSVPARHPDAELRRARPIEVDRVDGSYVNQTNPAEAARIVEHLGKLWGFTLPGTRPSVGVVTFNLKQADLIQDALQARAAENEEFRAALETEQARTQRGEDMSFFVKNLENVQGDERDWIIFSTTFGRDAAGTFRRNFGVLGQRGGERRLNVAVTRAREKVLLVTSMPVGEISAWTTAAGGPRPPTLPRDFLQGWLAYAERLDAGRFDAAQSLLRALRGDGETSPDKPQHPRREEAPPSTFADEVAEFLRGLGHQPVAEGGDAFGVDFALADTRTGLFGLGIECDAPSHALLAAARARELWRPSVLAASLPHLHRVRSRDWYHERASEQARLRAAVRMALGEDAGSRD